MKMKSNFCPECHKLLDRVSHAAEDGKRAWEQEQRLLEAEGQEYWRNFNKTFKIWEIYHKEYDSLVEKFYRPMYNKDKELSNKEWSIDKEARIAWVEKERKKFTCPRCKKLLL